MNVLVACEFSDTVASAFRRLGHNAWSNDILPTEGNPRFHIQGDCFDAIAAGVPGTGEKWDLLIAHPPCTYLANSGVRWLYGGKMSASQDRDPVRWKQMEEGARFFKRLLEVDVERIAVENPIMHGFGKEIIGREQDQVIQPWQFGHGETKATCLWLKNLPTLTPTNIVEGRYARVALAAPGPDRWKERSRFYPGFAEAMAWQWGGDILGA